LQFIYAFTALHCFLKEITLVSELGGVLNLITFENKNYVH